MDKLTNWPSYPHHNGDQPELFAEQIFQTERISLLVLISCHLVAIILITIAVAITIAITNIIILIISSNFQHLLASFFFSSLFPSLQLKLELGTQFLPVFLGSSRHQGGVLFLPGGDKQKSTTAVFSSLKISRGNI